MSDIIDQVGAKRGYLLPYHRMLALHAPELLAAYDAYYTKLTLEPRVLTASEREFVWVALQVAAREAHGTIHLRRAEAAGLDRRAIRTAVALSGAAESLNALDFSGEHWGDWTPVEALKPHYLAMTEAARGDTAPVLAELTLTVCQAARRSRLGMSIHLPRFFTADGTPAAMAEGLSYMLLPSGGPALIDAVAIWAEEAETGGYPGPY